MQNETMTKVLAAMQLVEVAKEKMGGSTDVELYVKDFEPSEIKAIAEHYKLHLYTPQVAQTDYYLTAMYIGGSVLRFRSRKVSIKITINE